MFLFWILSSDIGYTWPGDCWSQFVRLSANLHAIKAQDRPTSMNVSKTSMLYGFGTACWIGDLNTLHQWFGMVQTPSLADGRIRVYGSTVMITFALTVSSPDHALDGRKFPFSYTIPSSWFKQPINFKKPVYCGTWLRPVLIGQVFTPQPQDWLARRRQESWVEVFVKYMKDHVHDFLRKSHYAVSDLARPGFGTTDHLYACWMVLTCRKLWILHRAVDEEGTVLFTQCSLQLFNLINETGLSACGLLFACESPVIKRVRLMASICRLLSLSYEVRSGSRLHRPYFYCHLERWLWPHPPKTHDL